MMSTDFTVFIVDDDASVRDALALLISLRGYRTAIFASAQSFLDAFRREWRGCLLIDVRMPGMDGLALQKRLIEIGCEMPVIIITAHGDIASAREAFRARAIDFLEKPVDETRLIEAIEQSAAQQIAATEDKRRRETFRQLLEQLTPREREVMHLVVAGRHNRDIAETLGISVRTVEVHKTRMMTKLGVDNLASLVRVSLKDGGS